MVTLGGSAIFGLAITVQMVEAEPAMQVDSFFGLDGTVSLFGGTRGRTFVVRALMVGADASGLAANLQALWNHNDGVGRVLVDSLGIAWPDVVYRGFRQEGPIQWLAGGAGLALPYTVILEGRI